MDSRGCAGSLGRPKVAAITGAMRVPVLSAQVLPLLRALDPERAHDLTLWALARGLGGAAAMRARPALATSCLRIRFPNPLGLAAGFDKDARVPDRMLALGFGFVEVGTVTPRPQPGNPGPRLFRLTRDRAVINRLGFNNRGMAAMAARLAARAGRGGIVGVNIGHNSRSGDAVEDYLEAFRTLGGMADYAVVNVSSPNTPGLRDLQNVRKLAPLLEALVREREASGSLAGHVPLLLKLAPDLEVGDAVGAADLAASFGLDGLIVSNTMTGRPPALKGPHAREAGGLSGRPLFGPSTALLRAVYRSQAGALPIVGVGGIASAADAYAKIRAGASLVQLYTALVFQGPGLVTRILDGLEDRLARDGLKHVADAVGADA